MGISDFYAGEPDIPRDTEVPSESSKNYETFHRVSVLIAIYDSLIFWKVVIHVLHKW